MNDLISITELAALRDITTETLRHYDRIGLYKPDYIDPKTRYRYYSISYHNEKVGTIRELKKMGLSLSEIKDFFENRNIEKSGAYFKGKRDSIERQIKELTALKEEIDQKLRYIEESAIDIAHQTPYVEEHESKLIVTTGKPCFDDIEISWDAITLEKIMENKAPILGRNRFGIIRHIIDAKVQDAIYPFMYLSEGEIPDSQFVKRFESGEYLCICHKGTIWDYKEAFHRLLKHAAENGYKIGAELIQTMRIDPSITDQIDEQVCELQLAVRK